MENMEFILWKKCLVLIIHCSLTVLDEIFTKVAYIYSGIWLK
jgi:hypothetical protein